MRIRAVLGSTTLVASMLATTALAPPVAAASFTVDVTYDAPDADDTDGVCDDGTGNCTLRAAIMEANASLVDDTITLGSDTTYELTVTGVEPSFPGPQPAIVGDLDVFAFGGTNTTIVGNGSTIDATAINNRVFHVWDLTGDPGELAVSDLSIVGGTASTEPTFLGFFSEVGGGLLVDGGSASLDGVTVSGNEAASRGGGIAVVGGGLEVTNSTITNNTAGSGGGISVYSNPGAVTVSNTTISYNEATSGNGGGILTETSDEAESVGTTLTDVDLIHNDAALSGGGLANSSVGSFPIGGGVTFVDAVVASNTSGTAGGGIQSTPTFPSGGISLTRTNVTLNSTDGTGGGISASGAFSATDSSIDNNDATGQGGGLIAYPFGPLPFVLSDTVIADNTAASGGGFVITSPTVRIDGETETVISGLEVTGNQATTGAGGGVLVRAGIVIDPPPPPPVTMAAVVFDEATIAGNTAATTGGGLHNEASGPVIRNSTITANDALDGGGVSSGDDSHVGSLTIEASTISGNTASGRGGGVDNHSGTLDLVNSTLSGNSAGSSGGGLFNDDAATVEFTTVAGNTAPGGGTGIATGETDPSPATMLTASIVHDTATEVLCAGTGTITSGGYNVTGDATCNATEPTDQVADPALGVLADNGGSTLTHLPDGGSPAIDTAPSPAAGCGTIIAVDQRGMARAQAGACDSGSVETEASPDLDLAVTTTADTIDALVGDGNCDDGAGECSLRAAIQETNAAVGVHTIAVPAGTYLLTRVGRGENAAATGDLDVTGPVTITGTTGTTIDADGIDRIFEVRTGGSLTLSDTEVVGGDPGIAVGGGILANNATSLTLTDVTVADNTAHLGGGVVAAGPVDLTRASISANTSTTGGGGIVIAGVGAATITDSTITTNTAGKIGGGILTLRSLSLAGSTVADNQGTAAGGLYAGGTGTLDIAASTFDDNTATATSGLAGGIGTEVPTTITTTQLSGNQAGVGGGIIAFNSLAVTDTTIDNNHATLAVGGLGAVGPTLTVTNSTISANTTPGPGGGITHASTATLDSVTVTANTAATGAGVYTMAPGEQGTPGGTTTFTNSIVASQISGTDCAGGGGVISAGHNLSTSTTCALTHATDLPSTDPLLGPLTDNGGPTSTHLPQTGSPALDSGATAQTTDQRGTARPAGTGDDRGAVEVAEAVASVSIRPTQTRPGYR